MLAQHQSFVLNAKEAVMATTRSEKDSMGSIDVPANQLWGRKLNVHWRIFEFHKKMPTELIHALALTKRAAAREYGPRLAASRACKSDYAGRR